MDGFFILDKKSGVFSRSADWRVAKIYNTKKFGHIGTLDPMATGVLPIALGKATKMIPFIEECCENKKEYLFGLQFGFETDSLDITGKTTKNSPNIPNETNIKEACNKLLGTINQIPPIYSAIHINGQRAYKLAIQGEKNIDMPTKLVHIFELEYIGKTQTEYNFRVICSKGTYVRSIVRDIAHICNALATTTYIRRIYTSGFDIKNSVKLDFLENMVNNGTDVSNYLLPLDCALGDIPVISLNDKDSRLYKNGGFIATTKPDGMYRIYSKKEFIGIGTVSKGLVKPKKKQYKKENKCP